MTTRWLITGGCGFIGTRLVGRLLSEVGHSVRIVDNLSVGGREDLAAVCDFVERDSPRPEHSGDRQPPGQEAAKAELIVADVLDEGVALACCQGIDVIVHLAANTGVAPSLLDPRKDCVSNVLGTLNYLEAARRQGVRRFVFASSGAPIGECDPPIHEEVVPHPVSPYGASKLAGEAYCSAYFRSFGIETVALRFGNTYGPGSKHKNSVVAMFIRRALSGEPIEIYGDGSQTRDFIFVDDLTEAILKAATMVGIGGEIFQIATSRETAVHELSNMLISVLRSSGYSEIRVRQSAPRQGDVQRNFSDTSKARRLLGWQPRVGLQEGLRQTVLWFVRDSKARGSALGLGSKISTS